MLTAELSTRYNKSGVYNRGVHDLGGRLRKVREHLTLQQIDVARGSLDADATPEKIRDVGNYISRIERGVETNPSLELLERIAKGCGLRLSTLFDYIERSDALTLPDREVREHDGATSAVADGARSHVPGTLSTPDAAALAVLEDFVTEFSVTVAHALDLALERARARRSATGTDPH